MASDGQQHRKLLGPLGVRLGYFTAADLERARQGPGDDAPPEPMGPLETLLAEGLLDELALADLERHALFLLREHGGHVERALASLEGIEPPASRGSVGEDRSPSAPATWFGDEDPEEGADRDSQGGRPHIPEPAPEPEPEGSGPGPGRGGAGRGRDGTTVEVASPEEILPPSSPLGLSRKVRGRYRLLRWSPYRESGREVPTRNPREATIRSGGQGRILLAYDEHLKRAVAIKELLPERGPPVAADSARLDPTNAQFLHEARLTGRLEHPSIVPVYEVGQHEDDRLYYTMRLVRGRSLRDALQDARTLRGRLALLRHVVDLCHAIAYAHNRGVIHLDIKPGNVMVGEFGETVVLDWGLFRLRSASRDEHASLMDGSRPDRRPAIAGTPSHMAPEQARGEVDELDEQTDIWAVGIFLYELLTGTVPAGMRSTDDMLHWLSDDHQPVPPVSARCPEAPAELASIAMRCLKRDKRERYTSARDVARDIERYQAGERVVAHRYTTGELLHHIVTRNPPLSIAVGGLLLLAVVAAFFVRSTHHARQEAEAFRKKSAFEQVLLARAAIDAHRPLEAQARLRTALEFHDSPLARALWFHADSVPLVWRKEFATEVSNISFSPQGDGLVAARIAPDLAWVDPRTTAESVIPGPGENLYTARYSPAGTHVAAGAGNGDIVVFQLDDDERFVLRAHAGLVSSLAFDTTGELLLSGSIRGVARLWDLASRTEIQSYKGHRKDITCVAASPELEMVATASVDGTARLWEPRTGTCRAVLEGHEGEVTSLLFIDAGRTLVTASLDGTVRFWDTATGRQTRMLQASGARLASLAADDARSLLAAGDLSGGIHVWTLPGARFPRLLEAHEALVVDLDFAPHGAWLASSSMDRTVALWNLSSGQDPALWTHRGHDDIVTSVHASPDGERLVSAGRDGTLRFWDAASGTQIRTVEAHDGPVFAARFSPSGDRVATGGADDFVRLWDAATGSLLRVFTGHDDHVVSLSFDPEGGHLASGGYDGMVWLWDLRTGAGRPLVEGHGRTLVAFGPEPGSLVAAVDDHQDDLGIRLGIRLRILDIATGRTRLTADAGDSILWDLAVDRSRGLAYGLALSGELLRWDLETGERSPLLHVSGSGQSVALSPDGRHLAASSTDATLLLYDVEQGTTRRLHARSGPVADTAFGPSGQTLATAGYDGTVRTWDLQDANPQWHGTALLPALGLRHTHAGWEPLHDPQAPPPTSSWSEAVQARGRLATSTPAGRRLCLLTEQDRLELWDIPGDERLLDAEVSGATALVPLPNGCAVLREHGVAELLDSSGERYPLGGQNTAIASHGTGLLLATAEKPGEFEEFEESKAIVVLDGQGRERERWPVPIPQPTALAPLDRAYAVGNRQGVVALVPRPPDTGPEAPPSYLQKTPPSPVRVLLPGPPPLLAVGFDDGTAGLWDISTGRSLLALHLHGPVRHLAIDNGSLYALTELGDTAAMDLSSLEKDYCTLLREVWTRVPVAWKSSHVVPRPPPDDHRCAVDEPRSAL